jgi:aarF domain-containing kinase
VKSEYSSFNIFLFDQLLVNIASWFFPNMRLKWLVNETKLNLPKELDFLYEANNADRARLMFAHMPFVKVNCT